MRNSGVLILGDRPLRRFVFRGRFGIFRHLSLRAKGTCPQIFQQGMTKKQMNEIAAEKVVLVVPEPYVGTYPTGRLKGSLGNLAAYVLARGICIGIHVVKCIVGSDISGSERGMEKVLTVSV